MSTTREYKAEWDDIQAIYNSLNTQRERFQSVGGPDPVTVPDQTGNKVLPSDIKTIDDLITAMSSVSFIGSAATTGVVVPTQGNLLSIDSETTKMKNTLTNIGNICPYFSNNNGFSFFSFDRSFGWCSFGFFSFDRGFDFRSSNNDFGFRASNNDFGFRATNNEFSFRGGNNGFNFSSPRFNFAFSGGYYC